MVGNDDSRYACVGEQGHLWVYWLRPSDLCKALVLLILDECSEEECNLTTLAHKMLGFAYMVQLFRRKGAFFLLSTFTRLAFTLRFVVLFNKRVIQLAKAGPSSAVGRAPDS